MSPDHARPSLRLSELEGVVMGLIWADGPCTAYSVRRTVQQSLSPQWSGSAGAVYPAVARLEQRGLLQSTDQATGKRRSRALDLTPRGTRVLQAWVGPPVDPAAVGIPADPLRVRLRFLELLDPAGRQAFLRESIDGVEATVRQVLEEVRLLKRNGASPFEIAMVRGVLHATRARLKMLRELEAALHE